MSARQRTSSHLGPSFHQRLKESTGPVHTGLEAQLPVLDHGLTLTQYRRLLRVFFGFYMPLESSLDAGRLPAPLRAELACRRKSGWLLDDLLALGESSQAIGSLPLCRAIPPITSKADVFGAWYVVEGATLGGQIVLKSLRRSLGAGADHYTRFFRSYGSDVPQMWATFLRMLEAAAYDEVQEQLIMESARRTFTSFEQWLVFNSTHDQTPRDGESLDGRITQRDMVVSR